MSRFIKYFGIPVFAVAMLVFADASSAKAQGFSLQIGGFGISGGHHSGHHHPSHGVRPSFRRPSFGPSIGVRVGGVGVGVGGRIGGHVGGHGGHFGRPGYYHDTTHVDYHAPKVVPHNGHLDYVPGHYSVHRTGHWHH